MMRLLRMPMPAMTPSMALLLLVTLLLVLREPALMLSSRLLKEMCLCRSRLVAGGGMPLGQHLTPRLLLLLLPLFWLLLPLRRLRGECRTSRSHLAAEVAPDVARVASSTAPGGGLELATDGGRHWHAITAHHARGVLLLHVLHVDTSWRSWLHDRVWSVAALGGGSNTAAATGAHVLWVPLV